ncbi:MAG: hypothetical protein KAY37_06965 [Phycisphaerae bacterium]|nr:hypothetical protein [Phycisphaerae bacterium]
MTDAIDSLAQRIEQILRPNFPSDTIIDVSRSGVRDNLHVLVVSRALDNMSEQQKQEHLWSLLEKAGLNQEELSRVSLILPLSVEELRR